MEIKDAVRKRMSIRGYKKEPVSREILTEILAVSLRAPSGMNVQPWEITVVAGEPLDQLRRMNMELLRSGQMPESDFGHPKSFAGVHKERQRDLGLELYNLMGIARDDKAKRTEWALHGYRAFDAPAIIIMAADESLEARLAASDIGGLIQTICLVALEYGLGTCINLQGVMFPEAVRQVTGIPASKRIYVCIAVGYPDWDHPANRLISKRESVETAVSWVGFGA
jgi:nitroreductase